jgi:hypothetical protein
MKCTAIQVAGSYSECVVSGERKKKKKILNSSGWNKRGCTKIYQVWQGSTFQWFMFSLSLSLSQLGVIMYLSWQWRRNIDVDPPSIFQFQKGEEEEEEGRIRIRISVLLWWQTTICEWGMELSTWIGDQPTVSLCVYLSLPSHLFLLDFLSGVFTKE